MLAKYPMLLLCAGAPALLLGCRPIETPTVPTTTQSATSTATAVPTATVMPDVGLTPTDYATPTPIPTLLWADGISPIRLGEAAGHWSPVDMSLLLTNCGKYPRSADAIALAKAPDFEPHTLNDRDFSCDDNPNGSVEWSPDGTQILFVGPSSETDDSRFSANVWIMEPDGSNTHPLDETAALWWPQFLGWMKDSMVVVSSYTGGGSHEVVIWNIKTGEQMARSVIWGGWFEPSAKYVAGAICMPVCSLTAISTQVQSKPVEWYPLGGEYGISPNGSGSNYDEQTNYPNEDTFQQWIPGTNRALFSVQYYRGEGFARGTWLGVWDLDRQTITMLVPDGFYGRVSADGRYLMYLTVGPQQVDSQHRPLDNDGDTISEDEPVYVQLYDIASGTVIFSDAISRHDEMSSGEPTTDLDFAPNYQYAAIVVSHGGENNLIVLELSTQHIVFKLGSAAWKPGWSPDSQQIAFRDGEGNLAVLRLTDGTVAPITRNAAHRRIEVAWAQDSQTLSVIWAEGDRGKQQLAVIHLP